MMLAIARHILAPIFAGYLFLCAPLTAKCDPLAVSKKIIEFGWDTPSVQQVHDHVADWQDRPFDGIIFSLSDHAGLIFNLQDADPAKIKAQIALLKGVKWGRFTDNFIQLTCASTMDWISDKDWDIVLAHAKLVALAAKTAGCQGIVLDPEPYGGLNPWDYRAQVHSATVSFPDYQAKVRERGRQFVTVLQRELPKLKFFTFYQYSELVNELGPIQDPAAREDALRTNIFGLMPSFLDGMLEASNPNVEFIDGDERSYWFTSDGDFAASYIKMHDTAQLYVAPDLRQQYQNKFRAAQAIYTDYNFNLQPSRFPSAPAANLTAQQRKELFSSNLYSALAHSDEYVWIYSENWNWWSEPTSGPPGMEDAVKAVKAKIYAGKPLGFNVGPDVFRSKVKNFLAKLGL